MGRNRRAAQRHIAMFLSIWLSFFWLIYLTYFAPLSTKNGLLPEIPSAYAQSSVTLSPTAASAASDATLGCTFASEAWTNPTYAEASDTNYATVTNAAFDTDAISQKLITSTYAANLPAGSIIEGIVVGIEKFAPNGKGVDYVVQLTKVAGTALGTNKADTSTQWGATDPGGVYVNYGTGTTDKWGTTWTEAEVEGAGFGVVFCGKAAANNTDLSIDHIRVTIYYGVPITLSGTAYSTEGGSVLTSATVKIYQNGTNLFGSTTTDGSGNWSITGAVTVVAGDILTIYIDSNAVNGNIVFKSGGADKSGISLYGGVLSIWSDNATAITNANLNTARVGAAPASDMVYMVSGSNLTASSSIEVHIESGTASVEYDPGGTVTTGTSGNFHVATSSLAYLDSATNTIVGNVKVGDGAFLYIDGSTNVNGGTVAADGTAKTGNILYSTDATPVVTLGATGTVYDGNATSTFYDLTTSGSGTTTFNTNAVLGGDLSVGANTTVAGATNITVNGGAATGDGAVTMTGGTFTVDGNGTFGGGAAWNFVNLTLGNSAGSEIITGTGAGTATVSGIFKITESQSFNDGGKTVILSGDGTPLIVAGTLTPNSGIIRYTAASATTIATTTFATLELKPSAGGTPTYTIGNAASQSISATGLVVGNANPVSLRADTYNPAIDINGNVSISTGSTLVAPGAGISFTVLGTWSNSGTFTHNNGRVTFDAGSPGITLSGTLNGTSGFYDVTFSNASGGWSNSSAMLINNDLTMTSGTLSGTNNVTVNGGDVTGNGDINLTGGTFTLAGTSGTGFGGNTAWDFANLTLGDGTTDSITGSGTGSITVSGTMTIRDGQTFDANSKGIILSGSGTPFQVQSTATFTPNGSTLQYTSTSNTTVASTTYATLQLRPSGAGSPIYTLGSGATAVSSNLSLGDGTNAVTVSTSNNPTVTVTGDLAVNQNATFSGSGTGTITVNGGDAVGDGTINFDAGRFILDGEGQFGGNTAWSFFNLTFGDGSGVATSTMVGTGAVNASSTLSIAANQLFYAGGKTWNLYGDNSPFSITGEFNYGTSTFAYIPTSTTVTITPTTYYNLTANKSGATFTPATGSLVTANNLNITAGTLNLTANDNPTTISGTLTITGTLQASDSANLTISGTNGAMVNNGTFTHNNGTVVAAPTSEGTASFSGTNNLVFYNFTANTPRTTVKFEADDQEGEFIQVQNNLTISGTGGNPVKLESITPGTQWKLNLTGTQVSTFTYLVLKDCGCYTGTSNLSIAQTVTSGGGNDSACWATVPRGAGISLEAGGGGSVTQGGGVAPGNSDSGNGGGNPTTGGTDLGGSVTPSP